MLDGEATEKAEGKAVPKRSKKRVIVYCSDCGNEVECSPGMARYALEGKGVCARCGGAFEPAPLTPTEGE